MLPVLKDDTEPKQESAHRASEVPTLPVQEHRTNHGCVFEAFSSVQHQYSLNTPKLRKNSIQLFLM